MMFGKRQKEVELTEEVYERWLLAQRPPFQWFLEQPAMVQEQLADIGRSYVMDVCVAAGWATKDPRAAELGIDAVDDPEAEAELLQKVAGMTAQKILSQEGKAAPPQAPPLRMEGMMKRRREAEQARTAARAEEIRSTKQLFGRKPDGAPGGRPMTLDEIAEAEYE